MFSRSPFHHRSSTFARFGVLCAVLLIGALTVFNTSAPRSHASGKRQSLSFEDRVATQRAIEAVYHRHRIWPKDNPQPKPALDEVLPESALRAKVEDYLRMSNALEKYWQRPLTAEQLQAELERMAQNTKQPEVLRELYAALGNDPFLIAECLARPASVERLSRARYASDERRHGVLQQRATSELQQLGTGRQMQHNSGSYREVEWRTGKSEVESELARLKSGLDPKRLRETFGTASPITELPVGRWSGVQEDDEKFYAVAVLEKSAKRMKVAHVVWQKTPFDAWWKEAQQGLSLDVQATGFGFQLSPIAAVPEQCGGEAWTATNSSGAPSARNAHAAVWTGSEMLIWGGVSASTFNTGARYNPATDTWTAMTTTGAPEPRSAPAGIWSGVEMVVWGGAMGSVVGTGGRYNPTTNSWRSITSTDAPAARVFHTGVWSGSEMIVWGGTDLGFLVTFNSGGRYNPVTDTWRATTTSQVPPSRLFHAAVWAGNEMIIWGGILSPTTTGGRYNPVSDSWLPITTSNEPARRADHSLVWTGTNMIVWGGSDLNAGGQYNPATDSWTATSITNAPSPRSGHTAIWTGSEMIVWGGEVGTSPNNTPLNSGGRYNPITNTWTATSTTNTPSARYDQTALWSGNEMIIWGGLVGGATLTRLNTGGRYTVAGALTISPTNQSFPASGGNGNVSVSASGSCSWTATSNANWITITSGNSGSGNGTVAFAVGANTGVSPRTGTLTITGQTFTVNQAGNDCHTVLGLTPTSGMVGSTLTITGTNFTGVTSIRFSNNVTAQFTVNSATSITATVPSGAVTGPITISKQGCADVQTSSFTITQPCTYSIAPTSQSFTASGGAGNVAVTTGNGCSWTASSNANWLTITSGSSGSGNGTVNYTAAANTIASARTGTLTIAGQTFTVTQSGANPAPTIASLSPNSAAAGGAAFTLTVTGTNFINGAVVRWNNTARLTTFVSGTQLTASIPASDIATAGTANLTVFNPVPGGGTSTALPFTTLNPSPRITGLNPGLAATGDAAFTLTVTGSSFVDGTIVRWDGNDRPTTFVSATRVTAAIPATDLAANRSLSVKVFNPLPGGGESLRSKTFLVTNKLTISDLIPHTVITGGPAFTLTVEGVNFNGQSKVYWNDSERPTVLINNKRLTATISASDIAAAGQAEIAVVDSSMSGVRSESARLLINDLNLLAVDDGQLSVGYQNVFSRVFNRLTPAFYPATLAEVLIYFRDQRVLGFPVTILIGTDPSGSKDLNELSFQSFNASVVEFDKFNVYPIPNVTITSGDFIIGYEGIHTLFSSDNPSRSRSYVAFSSALGGGPIEPTEVNLMLRARLTQPCVTVTSINPTSASPNATVTLTGTNFTGVSAIKFANNVPAQFTISSATQITAIVPDSAVSGPLTLSKLGCTDVQTAAFTVTQNPTPTLTSLAPASAAAGGVAFTLTLTGANFVNGAVVRWNNADRPTAFGSATQLTAQIPATDIANAGTAQVTVSNPAPGGGISNALSFSIAQPNPTPVVNSLSPNLVAAGGAAFTLTVNGTNFVNGALVRWNGSERATTFVSATQLRAAIPAADLTTAGTASITVFNPPPGGGASGEAALTILRAFASASAASYLANELAPESIAAGFGSALAATTQAAATTPLPTTLAGVSVSLRDSAGTERLAPLFFVSPNQINYQIPANTAVGAAAITVNNGANAVALGTTNIARVAPGLFAANADGQGIVAGLALRVRNEPQPNPTPALTSLSPNSATAGSAALTLTVNGTGFVNGAAVRWNGSDRATTFVSATQLRAAIPASDLAAAATASVTVFNPAPGGGLSNALTFTISAMSNPAPTLTSLSHAMTTSGEAGFVLTANGSNFLATSVVRWNGQDRTTTFVSATQLRAEIIAADLATPGTATVTVFTPPPGGGSSSSRNLTIFDGSRDLPLTSGTTINGNFDAPPPGAPPGSCALRVFPQYTIQSPAGATQLRFALTSPEDLDIFVRFAQRVDITTTLIADYRADGLSGNETITITPGSTPALQTGKYFVMVGSCSRVATTFTLTATVTGGAAAALAKAEDFPFSADSDQHPDNAPATLFATKFAEPENGLARYLATPWLWRWGAWHWLPASHWPDAEEAAPVLADLPLAISFAAPQQQSYEALARFDTALNRFVALPLDLGPTTDEIYLILFGTGVRFRSALSALTARVGGVTVPVGYAGAQGDFAGLDQINIGPLPRTLIGRGEIDLVLTVDGRVANTVRINIK